MKKVKPTDIKPTKIPKGAISPDELWKSIIEYLFEDFVLFFIPELHEIIDWTKRYDFLEQELKKIFPKSKIGRKYNDKLAKVWLKSGQEQWILIHIEIQGYQDNDFAERMFVYYYRAFDRYKQKLVALAVFTDDDPDFLPKEYKYSYFNTVLMFRFLTYKILQQKEKELEKSENPFALAVLAGLYAIKTKTNNEEIKYSFKRKLIRLLKEKKYGEHKIRYILLFIDNLINLKPNFEELIEDEIESLILTEKTMELTLDNSNFAHAYTTLYKRRMKNYDKLVQRLETIEKEKDHIEKEKDHIEKEKEHIEKEKGQKQLLINNAAIKCYTKLKMKITEIADFLGISNEEVMSILEDSGIFINK